MKKLKGTIAHIYSNEWSEPSVTLIWWLIYEAGAFIMSLIWRHLRWAYVRGRGTGSPRGHLQCPKALPVRYHRVWLRSWLGSLPTWTSSVPPVFCQHLSISFKATPPVANDLHLTPLLLPPNDAAGWQPSLPHHWRKLIHTIPVPNTSFTFQILPLCPFLGHHSPCWEVNSSPVDACIGARLASFHYTHGYFALSNNFDSNF